MPIFKYKKQETIEATIDGLYSFLPLFEIYGEFYEHYNYCSLRLPLIKISSTDIVATCSFLTKRFVFSADIAETPHGGVQLVLADFFADFGADCSISLYSIVNILAEIARAPHGDVKLPFIEFLTFSGSNGQLSLFCNTIDGKVDVSTSAYGLISSTIFDLKISGFSNPSSFFTLPIVEILCNINVSSFLSGAFFINRITVSSDSIVAQAIDCAFDFPPVSLGGQSIVSSFADCELQIPYRISFNCILLEAPVATCSVAISRIGIIGAAEKEQFISCSLVAHKVAVNASIITPSVIIVDILFFRVYVSSDISVFGPPQPVIYIDGNFSIYKQSFLSSIHVASIVNARISLLSLYVDSKFFAHPVDIYGSLRIPIFRISGIVSVKNNLNSYFSIPLIDLNGSLSENSFNFASCEIKLTPAVINGTSSIVHTLLVEGEDRIFNYDVLDVLV